MQLGHLAMSSPSSSCSFVIWNLSPLIDEQVSQGMNIRVPLKTIFPTTSTLAIWLPRRLKANNFIKLQRQYEVLVTNEHLPWTRIEECLQIFIVVHVCYIDLIYRSCKVSRAESKKGKERSREMNQAWRSKIIVEIAPSTSIRKNSKMKWIQKNDWSDKAILIDEYTRTVTKSLHTIKVIRVPQLLVCY